MRLDLSLRAWTHLLDDGYSTVLGVDESAAARPWSGNERSEPKVVGNCFKCSVSNRKLEK